MLNIRPAGVGDAEIIHGFVSDLANYEHAASQMLLTAEDYRRYLQNGNHFDAFVAEDDNQAAGMALYYKRFSTWVGPYIHLEDIYVDSKYRGHGIGTELMRKVAATATEAGMRRMEWQVLNWNESAVKTYRNIGATILPEWDLCQLNEASLHVFANAPTPH